MTSYQKILKALLATVVALGLGTAFAQEKQEGVWRSGENFAPVNVGCMAKWVCMPSEDIMYSGDQTLKTTEPETTMGVCNAAGSADQCKVCMASAPETPCEWWLDDVD
ncbi:hypothetical protein F0M18_13625 [Pseudohalioglobus sediminis]|uniref:Uncharacterized protein n=1 Tax=Pseudohalioglobus sediminis TaxID=2606449 RepID=A0A5B0WSQ6_9GAMM|nr:hypothetical protein [Pseudohalioglobus sediminis]KAA1190100.1 hypothetical protein F0M18_13625 [Pseudohalioglobus sediminis]